MNKLILLSVLLANCGANSELSKPSSELKSTPFWAIELEEGLLITQEDDTQEAIFTASALLVARCASHPACRTVAVEGGKTLLSFAASTAAGGLSWDWANKNLCGGSCYDSIFGED